MKLFFTITLISTLFLVPIGDENGKQNKPTPETNIYFFQDDNITHVVFNSAILLVYYDSGDILCMVSHKELYMVLSGRGRLRLTMIYADGIQVNSFVGKLSKKDNIQIVDTTLKLCFIFITDKINYILNEGNSLMFRMVNGFSCFVSVECILPNSFFSNPMTSGAAVPKADYTKILKWIGERNGKKRKRN